MLILTNVPAVLANLMAAFFLNIYPTFQIMKRFEVSFDEAAELVSKYEMLNDKNLEELTREYVYAQIEQHTNDSEFV